MALLADAVCGVRNNSCSRKHNYARTSNGMASESLSSGVHPFCAQESCFFKQEHGLPRGSKQVKIDVLLTTVLGPLRPGGGSRLERRQRPRAVAAAGGGGGSRQGRQLQPSGAAAPAAGGDGGSRRGRQRIGTAAAAAAGGGGGSRGQRRWPSRAAAAAGKGAGGW